MSERKIKCLVVDDEPMALRLIESYAKKTPFLELRAACSNAFEALEILEDENIDLIFLDIQMPELTGVELSKTLSKNTRVIFTTAFNEYAIEGFKADALDYLLKPFSFDEFYNSALRAKEWFALVRSQSAAKPETDFLFVKADYKQVKIKFEEILYFEGVRDYIKVALSDNKRSVLTRMNLKSLEAELPESRFMRIHRSFIVNLDKIESIERSQVIIANQRITVADQYKERFQEFVRGNSIE
ncbi:LytTR family DNA-binding domain-containing protein [Flavobacterium sp.]|uniref:LytR/AlgR family response regulator transcription factor n=1 Tax=Flavobacterium sp. TaxID=239 RepID=UPI0011FD919F|nr:LytTR family DNA-binding domain-containing protein [Flavobacterium sp.]RZJ72282.1 MAG: response regulator transcription factor [Flavobacterium sp.]